MIHAYLHQQRFAPEFICTYQMYIFALAYLQSNMIRQSHSVWGCVLWIYWYVCIIRDQYQELNKRWWHGFDGPIWNGDAMLNLRAAVWLALNLPHGRAHISTLTCTLHNAWACRIYVSVTVALPVTRTYSEPQTHTRIRASTPQSPNTKHKHEPQTPTYKHKHEPQTQTQTTNTNIKTNTQTWTQNWIHGDVLMSSSKDVDKRKSKDPKKKRQRWD